MLVMDAVTLLRRSGRLVSPTEAETPIHRQQLALLHGVCAGIELRHNVSDGAGAELHRRCEELARDHADVLGALLHQWARPDVSDLACVETLSVCEPPKVRHEEL